jgi:hypothetical protein
MDVAPAPPAASARTTLQITRTICSRTPEYLRNYNGYVKISIMLRQKSAIILRHMCH